MLPIERPSSLLRSTPVCCNGPRLFLRQSPDTVPVGAWRCAAELSDTAEEDFARPIAGGNGETALESGARLVPSLAAIGVERLDKSIAQLEALACDLALAAEQLEDALRLALADDQHRINLPRLHRIGSEAIGRFADQHARAVGLIGAFEARCQIDCIADH